MSTLGQRWRWLASPALILRLFAAGAEGGFTPCLSCRIIPIASPPCRKIIVRAVIYCDKL
jgi:hypothetical protein